MDRRAKAIWCMGLLFPLLTGCGGGGGGGTSSSSETGVRVLHAAIEGTPVEVFASGQQSPLVSAAFSEASPRVEVDSKELVITERGNPSLVMGTHKIERSAGERFSLLLSDNGYRSWVIPDGGGDIPEGSAAIRLVHGVSQTEELTITVGEASAKAARQGRGSSYLFVPPGTQEVVIRGTGVGERKRFELEAGQSYTVLVGGEAGYLVTSVLSKD